jgi:sugar phosphate isomerase/epimerase
VKLGLSSYAYAWAIGVPGHPPARPMDACGLVDEALRLGVRVLQVCDNLPLLALAPDQLDAFERRTREAGIAVELGMRGLRHDDVVAHLALARRLGSPFLRIVVDSRGDEPSPAEVVARLRALFAEARRCGVKLALENHDRFTTATLVSIIEQAGPADVGICLDTVNSFGSLEGPGVVVRALAPYTVNLHLKDFVIHRVPSMMGFSITGAAAGDGRLDVPWLLAQLRAAGRDVNAILESWPPLGPSLEATIALERAWAETGVRNMRRLIPD